MRPSPLLLSILAVLPACQEEKACIEVDPSVTTCPDRGEVDVDALWLPWQCGYDIVAVRSDGVREDVGTDVGQLPACCYTVAVVDEDPLSECVVGRPYREDGALRLASVVGTAVDERAAAWARAAAGEHASVAAFARLALQLMAHGAPLDLLEAVHDAAIDEIAHTRACLARARELGADVVLGDFPFGAPVDAGASLAAVAAEAVREGCLAETLAAHVATVAGELAPDPAVRATLREIADDERRHAVLSWRVVAWAVARGGAEVRAAVRGALVAGPVGVDVAEVALRAGVDVDILQAAVREGVREVLRPAARALAAA